MNDQNDMVWGVGDIKEIDMDTASAEEVENMVLTCFKMRSTVKEQEKQTKDLKKTLTELQIKVSDYLKKFNKKTHVCEAGKFTISFRESAKLPQGENKLKFFEFLKERGVFEDSVHMNSKSFGKQCEEWREEYRETDPTWEVPGVTETITTSRVTMTPSKENG